MFIPPVAPILTGAEGQHAAWKPFESLDPPLFGVMVGCIAAANCVSGSGGWKDLTKVEGGGWRRRIES